MRREDFYRVPGWSTALSPIILALLISNVSTAVTPDSDQAMVEYWTGVIARKPSNHRAYAQRAEIRENLGEIDDAIDDITAAIRIEPRNAEYYNKRALLLLPNENRRDDAISDISKALELEPDNADFRSLRAFILAVQNRSGEALAEADRVVEAKPGDESAVTSRALLKLIAAFQSPSADGAVKAVDDFAAALPGFDADDALVVRSVILINQGKSAEAIADCTRYIELHPDGRDTAHIYRFRAEANRCLGEFAQALDDCTSSIRLAPDEPLGYSQKAWLLATYDDDKARDGKLAVELAKRACELSGWKPRFQQVLAAAYAECGDFEQAIQCQTKALAAFDTPDIKSQTNPGRKPARGFTISLWPPSAERKSEKDAKRQEAARYLEGYRQHYPVRE